MNKSENRFTPIRGLESSILASTPTNGYVWFATDTKKIYYSNGTSFISMGGNSSIFYGIKDTSTADDGQTEFIFNATDDLEDTNNGSIPQINDLILNSDGCFYRVIFVSGEDVTANKLTIAGSGSGDSGGSSTGTGTATVEYITPSREESTNVTVLQNADCLLTYKMTATDSSGDSTGSGTVSWYKIENGISTLLKTETVPQGENTVNAKEFFTATGSYTLQGVFKLWAGGDEPRTVRKSWSINVIKIELNWDYDLSYQNVGSTFQLKWNVVGDVSKTTYITIDNGTTIYEENVTTTKNTEQVFNIDRDTYGLTHGVHKISLKAQCTVNGTVFTTDTITKEILFIDSDNTEPLIAIGDYSDSMEQYNTQQIPIVIYNSNTANLYVNDVQVDTWYDLEASIKNWSFTPNNYGEQRLKISCDGTERTILIQVSELEIDNTEIANWAFKLKASEFASNTALQAWTDNNVTATYSDNFDWTNGGLQTETDDNGATRQFICIKAGTSMTINYKMFESFLGALGKNFKIIFKVANCGQFDAEFLKCVTTENNRTIGLSMNAQQATFSSSANSIVTQYCENSYIEYEFDIYPSATNASGKSEKYLMPWINGVPVGIKVYDTDIFKQTTPVNITIGSEDCDVYIYLIKVYEKYLKTTEHISNFIADASNASDMLARFRRNDILDDQQINEINWQKLISANPDCEVHLYDIPKMTTNKKDKVKANEYKLYKSTTTKPVIYAGENYEKTCEIKVQGTSSAAYGIAAFNIDTNFKNGMFNGDNEELEGYSLDSDAIAETYFTTKVNVASCEGGNNAINQEWYNKFQPYTCSAKKKNSKHRDTMKFKPGVMFVLDRNTETNSIVNNPTVGYVGDNVFKDTSGYIDSPYYKLYSVCNFGNSKKNFNTLHDTENPYEICIENTDNQQQGQWMVRAEGFDETLGELDENNQPKGAFVDLTNAEILDDNGEPNANFNLWVNALNDKNFDLRYVNGSDGILTDDGELNATQQQIVGFFELVKWMAKNDPSEYNATNHPYGYTGADFTADTPNAVLDPDTGKYTVHFDKYTFKAKDWKNDSTVLGGLEIQTYAGDYTTDCKNYRMAKMLSECEDHLIMDSFVFHYLFIERHTLIDNVAKNTFWSAEDANSQYWSIIKDYDNDTSDGNDNSGRLTLTYGNEVTDMTSEDPPVYVFNAYHTVWLHFIMGLDDARKKMYQTLDEQGAWNATEYLDDFLEWQSAIPERCWIEDYYRKYIRPYEVYNDNTYFERLEGGQKTEQRKQFETYQELYLATKYQTNSIMNTSNSINLRANAVVDDVSEASVPVKVYSDCYINTRWGQDISTIRAKRGNIINIVPYHTTMNDETVYWFTPNIYSYIGDIGKLAPKTLSLSGATKIQSFSIDNASILCSIGFEGNVLLKHLSVTHCNALGSTPGETGATITDTGSGQSLNLSDQVSLQDLDLTGSRITALVLPNNAPITEVSLNDELASLVANNLRALETLTFENDTNVITTLILNNIDDSDINSLDLVKAGIENNKLTYYGLKNVQWTIDDETELSHIDDEYNIPVLDELLTLNPQRYNSSNNFIEDTTNAEALTGTLTITANAYDGTDSLGFYNAYVNSSKYPNLDIQFESENSKLITINILNGNGEVVWYRKSNSTPITVENGFLTDGPKGAFLLSKITKSSTDQYQFTFNNTWEIQKLDGTVLDTITSETGHPYYETNITESVNFVPQFTQSNRTWTVRTFDYTGETLVSSGSYNAVVTTLKDAVPKTIPYKPEDDDFELTDTYKFMGYSQFKNSTTIIDLNTAIKHDYDLYPIFTKQNVYDNVMADEYLDFIETSTGYKLKQKSGMVYTGKVTLPIKHNNKMIEGLADTAFGDQTQITHIFWQQITGVNCAITKIENNAFVGCLELKYFEMPETVRVLGSSSFFNSVKLFVDRPQSEITAFFKNLTEIQASACSFMGYNNANWLSLSQICYLPDTLTKLGETAFGTSGFRNYQIGDVNKPSQLDSSQCGTRIFINGFPLYTLQSFKFYVADETSTNTTNLVGTQFGVDTSTVEKIKTGG